MSEIVGENEAEEIIFQATVFCGGPVQNEEFTKYVKNVISEEDDIHQPSTTLHHQLPTIYFNTNEDRKHDSPQGEGDMKNKIKAFKGTKRRKHEKKRFTFNKRNVGIKAAYVNKLTSNKPYDFFRTFIDDKFLLKMVDATNEYALMCKENNQVINSWIQPWRNTNIDEMRKFIGIIIWMGLVKYPTMNSYWCRSHLYTNRIMNSVSRSQFQLLSHMWRLGLDDERSPHMISPLLNDLRKKFKQMLIPPEVFAIDKMFIPSETETEGINILFLNVKGGYIYDFSVTNGDRQRSVSLKSIMALSAPLLDKGRTMCSNEDLTSVTLAKKLLDRNTHLLGLINPNSCHIPLELKTKRIFGNQSEPCTIEDGITICKYNPFSEQYLLTTRPSGTIAEFYKYRSATTIAHELKINNLVLMNSMNWYQKYAVEIVINACLVNACYLYRKICSRKISSIRFMEDVISGLLGLPMNIKPSSLSLGKLGIDEDLLSVEHIMIRLSKSKRCAGCYERICREDGRKIAMNKATKTTHQCPPCNKSFCIDCFFVFHTGRLKTLM